MDLDYDEGLDEEDEREEEGDFIPVSKSKPIEYTSENLFKKLREVMEARGKKVFSFSFINQFC